jgi:hypothetical protein
MKAEEAKKMAAENAKEQIDLIMAVIREEVENGQLSKFLDFPLKEATIKHLKDNGYAVIFSDGTNMYKKWRLKISRE